MHDTLNLQRLGGVVSHDIAQPRSLAADDCKATQHQASVLGAVHAADCAGKSTDSDVMQLQTRDGRRDASFSDAATSTAAFARSANALDDEASPQQQKGEAGAKTNTTADTVTNQHMSTDAVNSEQQNQQQSAGAVWQLSAGSQQQLHHKAQHMQNSEHLVKMLFAAALHNGVCKPQQQGAHQQASFSSASLISPASCMQLQLLQQQQLQQQQQVLGSLLQPAAAVLQQHQGAVATTSRVAALPTVSSAGHLAATVAQPALVALPQCPPFMVALAPVNSQLATAAVQHQQPSKPQQQPLQGNQPAVPQQGVDPAQQQQASPRAMHAAMGDRAFYSIRSLLLAQQDMFVQQLYELHRLARVQSLAWSEVMPARSPQAAPGAPGSADVKSSSQASKHQLLTTQYGAGALAAVRSASARSKASNVSAPVVQQRHQQLDTCDLATSKAKPAVLLEPALADGARNTALRSPGTRALMSSAAQQSHEEQAGAWAVTDPAALAADDVGAAAVADLPVHLVLLANIPSAMRKAVSQPRISGNFARLNPAQYYARRDAGMLRPTAMRYMGDAEAAADAGLYDALAGSSVGAAALAAVARAAAAAATAAGTSCSEPSMHPGALGLCDDTVVETKHKAFGRKAAGPAPDTHQPAQRTGKRAPQRSTTTRSLSSKRPVHEYTEAAVDAATAAAYQSGVMYESDRELQLQQSLQMPPPPPMLPELAAQHFAAAAAAQQHFLQLQVQQAAEQQACDAQEAGSPEDLDETATAAAGQPSGGLNVFRPMAQINPMLASRFLAGGANAMEGLRPTDTAPAAAQFDPHSYWMSKHYGAAAAAAAGPSSQQQHWQQQHGLLDTAAAAAGATSYGLNPVGMDAAAHVYGSLETGGLANVAAAAAAAAAEAAAASMGAAGSCGQQYGASVAPVHWWQDAQATFGDIGLIDPDALPPRTTNRGGSRSRGSAGNKRWLPQQQQAHSKKRSKHGAAAAYGAAGQAKGWQYDMVDEPEGYLAGTGALLGGAFKPPVHPMQERSRVRSNGLGVSSRQEASVGSDNSASSIDNPAYAAAAAAAAAAELGPDAAEGVMLLHHMRSKMRGHAAAGGRGGRGRMASGASAAAAEMSCQGSGVAGNHHMLDTSAAGILMSLSNSKSTAD